MADVKRLNAAIDYCVAHPEEHDQSEYAVQTACGTKLCLAGTALVLNGWRPVFYGWSDPTTDFEAPDGSIRPAHDAARELLDLTADEADCLFLAPDIEEVLSLRDRLVAGEPLVYGVGWLRGTTAEIGGV